MLEKYIHEVENLLATPLSNVSLANPSFKFIWEVRKVSVLLQVSGQVHHLGGWALHVWKPQGPLLRDTHMLANNIGCNSRWHAPNPRSRFRTPEVVLRAHHITFAAGRVYRPCEWLPPQLPVLRNLRPLPLQVSPPTGSAGSALVFIITLQVREWGVKISTSTTPSTSESLFHQPSPV
jgi:hypothetical protein